MFYNKSKKSKKLVSWILLFVMCAQLLAPIRASAYSVTDIPNTMVNTGKWVFNKLVWSWEKFSQKEVVWREHWAAVGFKAALHGFLRKLAVDSATYVASGDKGQKPMIYTSDWKEYMHDAADEAAGTFIMASADQWDRVAENEDCYEDHNNCADECSEDYNNCLAWDAGDPMVSTKDFCNEKRADCISECNAVLENDLEDNDAGKGVTAGSAGQSYSKGIAGSIVKFLCEPDFNIKMKITAGLAEIQSPSSPKCTYSSASKNWDEFVNDENFLTRFQAYWNPEENDIGIALTMHNDLLNQMKIAQLFDAKGREEGLGFKAVTNKIGGILTPGTVVQEAIGLTPIKKGTKFEEVHTGDIIADAVATFANTLMSKMINKWIMEGMDKLNGDDDSSDYNWLNEVDSSASRAARADKGAKAAKAKYSKVFQPDYKVGGAYSILEKLLMCSDLKNMGPTDCVITQPFADAINQELTVQQAIDEGYISAELPFGFEADGMEPLYNQGYPYRSLIILRKYRIIPVGWELAARYIGDFISNSSGARTYNIQEIIDAFDDSASPFYQLIDPNWVLKAPEVFCEFEGIGEKIIGDVEISQGVDVDNDGDYDDEFDQAPKINILREGYCVDEKSCLIEDSKGNCLFYGHCSEEKRIWDFQGDKCESYYNTCQSFISPQGKQVSYLKNSLDYSGCGEDNAGCKWYCDSRNASDGAWACLSEEWDLNLDNYCDIEDGCEIADSEDVDQDGDITESCVVPHKGIECILDGSKARLTYNRDLVPNVNNDIYLNQKAESCSSSSEGCREYIRTKPNLGTNLLTNSSFEDDFTNWNSTNGATSSASFIGNTAFESLDATASLTKIIETGHSLEGRKFILSFYAQNCMNANFQFYIPGVESSTIETIGENNDDWERFSVAYNFSSDGTIKTSDTELTIDISGTTGMLIGIPTGCLIDAVQFEEVSGDGYQFSYEGYHNSNSLYLKKAPDYYHCEFYTVHKDDYDSQENCEVIFNNAADCGTAGYFWDGSVCIYSAENRDPVRHFWRTDITRCVKGGSEQCADFALECGQGDVGCDLYEPINGDPSIPGTVRSDDFCPEVCSGYDTYKQEATFFKSIEFPEFFIPNNEKKCSAQNAGCSEFTNLDKLAEGGEAVEYYTYLRPCHKIDSNCASFYTWVGSEETGFQLVAHLLLDADSDGIPDNVYNLADAADIFGDCNDYDDAIGNPECNEFYSESNAISYRHYKNTITCSDGCHPYRKTKIAKADCVVYSAAGWDWGEWSAGNECIYESLPEQGIKCPSSQNNCYEYKGNTSHNVRKVIDDGFETAINSWGIGEFSSESLIRGGHSLKVNNGDEMNYSLKAHCDLGAACLLDEGCECRVDDEIMCFLQKGEDICVYKSLLGYQKTYFLSFWAKGSGNLEIGFSSASLIDEKFASGSISLGPEWQEYSLGPVLVDWDMDIDDPVSAVGDNILETLKISGFDGASYIDNIILKEERDNLFLIRPDFWNVSAMCDQDHNSSYAPQYMLGCEEYKSEIDKENVFLKSFSRLCDEGVVGCEALIDTFNSYNYLEEIFNLADKSEIIVFADNVDFLVNNKSKVCQERDKGCIALGMAKYRYNQNSTTEDIADDRDDLCQYETVHKINDPDTYDETLCLFNDVGCGKFSSDSMGDYYFKDPVSQRVEGDAKICEYKMAGGQTTAGWYLANTTSGEPNCPLAYSDVGVEYAAKTCLGGGEKSGEICESDTDCPGGYCANWTGVCPSDADGCTEYIDPISSISKNIVFNGDWTQDVDSNAIPDGWHDNGSGDYVMDVPIYLEQDTVYTVLSHSNGAGSKVVLENCVDNAGDPVNLTSSDDSMDVSVVASASIVSDESDRQFSGRFYTGRESPISCDLRVSGNLVPDKFVKILKTGIYYNTDSSIDKADCNGLVDYEKGCVLFNRREIYQDLMLENIIYDADRNTKDENTPQSCSNATSTCDSNLLIKVKPTRTCGEWLYCKSRIKTSDNKFKCTDIGLCNSLDDKGMCDGFVIKDQINQTAGIGISLSDIRDKSGYAKIGKSWGAETINGYYPFQEMSQEGGRIDVPNGNFEKFQSDGRPDGWIYEDGSYDSSYFVTIHDPLSAEGEGLPCRAPEGRSFLKGGAYYNIITSQQIPIVITGDESSRYFLDAYMNTVEMSKGELEIQVQELNAAGDIVIDYYKVLSLNYAKEWQHELDFFDINATTNRINIRIKATEGSNGNFFVDDIRIKHSLNMADNIYSSQTCRSYPKTSSLSCEYLDDAGIRNLGRYGYCIESDPANPSQCLIWWPVIDMLSGESAGDSDDSDFGYDGEFPVYYCADMDANFDFVEKRTAWQGFSDSSECMHHWWAWFGGLAWLTLFRDGDTDGAADDLCGNHTEYMVVVDECDEGCDGGLGTREYIYAYCVPISAGRIVDTGNISFSNDCDGYSAPNNGWYVYNGSFIINEATSHNPPVMIYDYTYGSLFYPNEYRLKCDKFYQTVTGTAENKVWANRVRVSSDYRMPTLGDFTIDEKSYMYDSDRIPFGSIIPPKTNNDNDPEEWDGVISTDEFDRILFRENLSEEAIAGLPYGCHGASCSGIGRCSAHPELFCIDPLGVWDQAAGTSDELLLRCPGLETCNIIDNLALTSQSHGIEILKRIFAQSYNTWEWKINHYEKCNGVNCVLGDWNPPDFKCQGFPPARPIYDSATGLCNGGDCFAECGTNPAGLSCDWCGVPPIIKNIKIGDIGSGNYLVHGNKMVNLTFNSIIEYNQLPLVLYEVNWSNGTDSNPNITDEQNPHSKPNIENPHSLSTTFEYWGMNGNNASSTAIECGNADDNLFLGAVKCPVDSPCCATKPKIRIKDNWDWCNSSDTRGDCVHWKEYNGYIVVSQH